MILFFDTWAIRMYLLHGQARTEYLPMSNFVEKMTSRPPNSIRQPNTPLFSFFFWDHPELAATLSHPHTLSLTFPSDPRPPTHTTVSVPQRNPSPASSSPPDYSPLG
jgi:hypothetical protein